MGKLRVFELAKEMGISNKVIMQKLNDLGYNVSTHFAGLDDEQIEAIRKVYAPKNNDTKKKEQETKQPETEANVQQQKKNIHIRRFDVPMEKPREKGHVKQPPQGQQSRPQGNQQGNQNARFSQEHHQQGDQNRQAGQQNKQRQQNQSFNQGQQRQQEQRKGHNQAQSQGQQRPHAQHHQGQNRIQNQNANQNIKQQNRQQQENFRPKQDNFVSKPKPINIPTPPAAPVEKPKRTAVPPAKQNQKLDKRSKFDQESPVEQKIFARYGQKKAKGKNNLKSAKGHEEPIPQTVPKIVIGETVTVQELAKGIGKSAAEVIKKLFAMGVLATINQEIDSDTAVIIASEFGAEVEVRVDKTLELIEDREDAEENLESRPPVVTVMGHVDHGKTSLLDAIRETNVISTEAGGITQHIGAYQVEINNRKITFLDTPGHEAFTAMRARGAQVTDVVILVVAADDGIMPQTVEAINHAKAAGVPIIVAINKIDKPEANPDRVKQELTEYGLVPEEWGGDTICVNVSAKKRMNIEHLLEMVLLTADILELKANPNREARGTVVEAELDKGRGPVATMLIQKGTLNIGDIVVVGTTYGRVRAMVDDKGKKVKSAGPSMPVEVLGLSEVPPAGETFIAVKDEKTAKHIAESRFSKKREEEMRKNKKVSLDDLFKQIEQGEVKDLNVIVKADVQGSVEALRQSLEKLSNAEVRVNVIHGGVGTITESDVMLATASNAIILGFNVRPDAATRKAAENENVDIRLYRVIYDAIDDVKAAMSGLLAPTYKEVVLGRAEVRQVFKVPKAGMVAGCMVIDGKITRVAEVRIIRDGIVVHEGKIESLKRFKDDVKEVMTGFECGIGIEKFNDIKEGDIIEAFIMEEVKREL